MNIDEVTRAYREKNNNLWETGKIFFVAGGEIRRTLISAGVEIKPSEWSKDELTFIHRAVAMESMIASQIAEEIGRNPAVVMAKCNDLYDQPVPTIVKLKKVPYGQGYTKRNAAIRIKELADKPGLCVLHYCKALDLDPRALVQSFKAYYPERLPSIASNLENVIFTTCPYCGVEFANRKHNGANFCSNTCNRKSKIDAKYFGGKRRETLGVRTKTCQNCGQKHDALQVDHIIRKGNDSENEHMIALCPGCHRIKSVLAIHKSLTTNRTALQALIAMALAEMDGGKLDGQLDESKMRWFPISGQERTKFISEGSVDLSDPLPG
jgi:5-methylcytosine-specific restriction endonuclease McrA